MCFVRNILSLVKRCCMILWICMTLCLTTVDSDSARTRQEVTSYLLNTSRYDSSIVPDFEKDYPTNVTIQIIISDMHSISEAFMEYSLDILLRQWWRDGRLDYSNVTSDVLELDPRNVNSVWQPDLFFANEKRATVHTVTTTNKLVHMFPNGTVVYSMRLAMTLSCTMDLEIYPFDKQTCPLFIKSFAYTKDNINLRWREPRGIEIGSIDMPQFELHRQVDLTAYIEVDDEIAYTKDNINLRWREPRGIEIGSIDMPQFELHRQVDLTAYIEVDDEIGAFSTLKAEIHMERKLGFFLLQVFVPCVLLVALSWVNFWVDPHAVPARVSLGVTCVLTLTTQSAGTRQSLPPVSYVKAIDVWMFVCLVFVFAALLEFAYVNVLLRYDALSHDDERQVCEEKKRERRKMAIRVDYISRIVFPGVFFLFVVTFAAVYYLKPNLNNHET